jgi:hypothetical protein
MQTPTQAQDRDKIKARVREANPPAYPSEKTPTTPPKLGRTPTLFFTNQGLLRRPGAVILRYGQAVLRLRSGVKTHQFKG